MPSEKPEPDREGSRSRLARDEEREADQSLMARVSQGDAQAFEEIVNSGTDRVVAVARRMLGSNAEAEDVAQEAFLRLWHQAENWEGGRARISTWLYRVTVNLSIDRLRARREEATEEPPDDTVAPTQQQRMEEDDLRSHMDRALQDLPERQRLALVLFHYENLSMTAVADIMESSVEAVESLLARGRRGLKKRLRPHWKTLLPEGEE